MMVLKNGYTSTLDIIAGIKKKAAAYKDSLPDTLKIGFVGDQGVFVAASIEGVVREGIIAAVLTSVMILLFLGSWRSTIIIATSIPLAVFGSIIMLAALRRNPQHHDAGRPRARGRYSRRRSHGDDREHQLASGAGQGSSSRDPRWRSADRGAGVRVAALYLHRVHPDVLPPGHSPLPVRADGGSGDLRDDLVVHPVANAGADDGDVSAEAASARARRSVAADPQSAGLVPARLRERLRKLP